MAHVKDLVHLSPLRSAFFADDSKQRRNVEEIVFDNMQAVDEVQHFCLCSAAAVDNTMNALAVLGEHLHHNRSVGACWGQYKLTRVNAHLGNHIGYFVMPGIHEILGDRWIE